MFEFILPKKLRECARKIKDAKKATAESEIIILRGSLARLTRELTKALAELEDCERIIKAHGRDDLINQAIKKKHQIQKEYGTIQQIKSYIKKLDTATLKIGKKK